MFFVIAITKLANDEFKLKLTLTCIVNSVVLTLLVSSSSCSYVLV